MNVHKLNGKGSGRGTFIVEIQHQDNSTWQGKVTWAEGGRKETFRSALELMKMMEDALSGDDEETESVEGEEKVWQS